MSFAWLKRFVPRGLYGRAALILLLPVVALQVVVSVAFVQRHFEEVTVALSRDVAEDLAFALRHEPERAVEIGAALGLRLAPVSDTMLPAADAWRWYDGTAGTVRETLREALPGLERIVLPYEASATLYVRAPKPDGDMRTAEHETLWRVEAARDRFSAANPHQFFVILVVFGSLMTVIAFLYLRNQLRPIARLARAAEAFGRGRVERYSPGGAAEVRAAGLAFLDMRARIERQIEQRTLMLSGVSHDLRTPLTRMKLGLTMLDDAAREPLERDVQDMQRLIDAFLDFARGDAARQPPDPADPAAIAESVVARARAVGGDVSLGSVARPGMLPMRGLAVSRALENLVANAVRHGTRCRVSLSFRAGTLRYRVEDDGPGIPEAQREDALRPFVRLDPARNQNAGTGVGLGLAIAADIARSHGGSLELGRSAEMGGLRIDLVLPV